MTRKILLPILLATLLIPVAGYGRSHSVKATLDSVYILMGKQTTLHLEVVEDASSDGFLVLPKGDTLVGNVEVIDATRADTTDLGSGRRQINQEIVLQSFDSGLYTLPPLPYVNGGDTMYTKPLTLKVIPVMVDSLATIHPYAGTEPGESRWYDWMPDWITDYWVWYLIALLLVAGGLSAWLLFSKKAVVSILPAKKPEPPYEIAIRQLGELRERHLCEQGQEREFYTRLTEILRDYLQGRFGINAMEMTSTQIIQTLQDNEATRLPNRYMREILAVADFVKFAKQRPLPEDNTKAFNQAMQFVEDTKPAPEEKTEDNEETAESDSPSDDKPTSRKGDKASVGDNPKKK
ncbi:MAG: BatD family protein [Bacteroidales bacterium]|nr:BatD family protein [Bacteroidales bacterium]MCD8394694.1 BatD family protein [Bacteroidales bacterium]